MRDLGMRTKIKIKALVDLVEYKLEKRKIQIKISWKRQYPQKLTMLRRKRKRKMRILRMKSSKKTKTLNQRIW